LIRRNLLDLNVLIALTDDTHQHYRRAWNWLKSPGQQSWGICPLTEAGYVRVTTNPAAHRGARTLAKSAAVLEELAREPGYCYWPITESWAALTAPFADRIFGHQQVTDAYLLGLAIKENGVLVTFDKAIQYMAGSQFSRNLRVLE
jgi:toxin-antitoxin system PIN domain toxin